jgi:p-cymene methyl-monooxygenase electron transfer component
VEVPPGKTLLEAAIANGLNLPHDCTVGTCGTCKSRLLVGKVQALSEFAYTLSAQELAANYILPCQSKPLSPLVRIETAASRQTESAPAQFKGHIRARVRLTNDIEKVLIELDGALSYIAGQYLNLSPPDGSRARSYSFAEPPQPGGRRHITLFIRKVPGGRFTEALFAGELDNVPLHCDGPHGLFKLGAGAGPMICLAGGSGLAPILSILEDAARSPPGRPCTLLFGARTPGDLYALENIDALTATWGAPFKFLPVVSHERADSPWKGARGLVTEWLPPVLDELSASSTAGAPKPEAYLCGPPAMIDAAIVTLTARGLPLDSIFYDKFTDSSSTV